MTFSGNVDIGTRKRLFNFDGVLGGNHNMWGYKMLSGSLRSLSSFLVADVSDTHGSDWSSKTSSCVSQKIMFLSEKRHIIMYLT